MEPDLGQPRVIPHTKSLYAGPVDLSDQVGRLVAVELDVADTCPLDNAVNHGGIGINEDADGGDPRSALDAIDQIEQRFEINAYDLRMDAMDRAFRSRVLPREKGQWLDVAISLLDEGLAADRFAEVENAAGQMVTIARRAKNNEAMRQIIERRKAAVALGRSYRETADALETLKEKPDDPAELGSFRRRARAV